MSLTAASFVIIFLSVVFSSDRALNDTQFKLGNETLLESGLANIKNKRLAVVTNQTGITSGGTHIIDELISKGCNIVKIFSPEHGIRGDENYSEKDEKTGLPIIPLSGSKIKPSSGDLSDVDILIYDIQDVGARFYTYTSTLYYLIQAASENDKKLFVCDRPIIINPGYIDGFMLDPAFSSFVGKIPAPVCYGMTCGELALYLADYLGTDVVSVSKMQAYDYSDFESLSIVWEKPSPNILTSRSALCYPATCFLEGTNVSEGRGSNSPFEYFGAPWINSEELATELNNYQLNGVKFEPVAFTPSQKISSYPPKFFGEKCSGIYINVVSKHLFEPVKAGVAILLSLHKLYHDFKFLSNNFIDKLAGTDKLRKIINDNKSLYEITSSWQSGTSDFAAERQKFLLYNK